MFNAKIRRSIISLGSVHFFPLPEDARKRSQKLLFSRNLLLKVQSSDAKQIVFFDRTEVFSPGFQNHFDLL